MLAVMWLSSQHAAVHQEKFFLLRVLRMKLRVQSLSTAWQTKWKIWLMTRWVLWLWRMKPVRFQKRITVSTLHHQGDCQNTAAFLQDVPLNVAGHVTLLLTVSDKDALLFVNQLTKAQLQQIYMNYQAPTCFDTKCVILRRLTSLPCQIT